MITTNSRREQWPHYVPPSPPTLPPFVHRQSKIKSIKFPAGKGERIVCWRTTSSLGNNKFVAPCESEVSLLLGHTLRIACTLKRRNNAAYKFRRHCGGFVPTEIDREFFYQRHIFQAMINFRRKILDFFIIDEFRERIIFERKKKEKEKKMQSRVATIESIVSREFLGGRSAKYRGIRGIRQNQTISIYTFYNSMQRRRVRSDTCFHSNKLGSPIIISIHCIALRALHKRTDYVFDRCVALDRLFSRASKTILMNRRHLPLQFFFLFFFLFCFDFTFSDLSLFF